MTRTTKLGVVALATGAAVIVATLAGISDVSEDEAVEIARREAVGRVDRVETKRATRRLPPTHEPRAYWIVTLHSSDEQTLVYVDAETGEIAATGAGAP